MNAASKPHSISIDRSARDHPVRPTRGLSVQRWLLWWSVWCLWLVLDTFWFRLKVRGTDHLPKDGPCFVLSNHTATLDPFWTGWAMQRPLHYMAATSVLRIPVLGKVAEALGAFPKKKYIRDTGSMKKMMSLVREGHGVVVYPEGMRTWNGEGLPTIPGMGRLIRKMRVPVIYARLDTAFVAHPRWAKFPRWVPMRVTFDGPYTYGREWSAKDIEDDIQRRIRVVPHLDHREHAAGFRLAWGLTDYLWACPSCFAEEGLAVDKSDGNRVACRHCKSAWRVDLRSVLHGEGDAGTWTLPEASRHLADFVGTPPVLDRARFELDGVLLEAHGGHLLRCLPDSSETEPVTDGTLQLLANRLVVLAPDGSERWGVALVDITAVSVEVAHQVYIRVDGQLYALNPADQSTCKWGAMTRAWHAVSKGATGAAAAIGAP